MTQEKRRSTDVVVRNGKGYIIGLVLVGLTAVISLSIGDVFHKASNAPVQNAIQAGEIELLRLQIKTLEDNQLKFQGSVNEKFKELKETSNDILKEVKKGNETMRDHIRHAEE